MARKARFKITDKDLGWRALKRAVNDTSAGAVTVGPRGARNVQIGTWAEFGTSRQPARPHIRPTLERNAKVYRKLMRALTGVLLDGKLTKRAILLAIGKRMAADIVARVRAHVPPPNAPATIAAKGSSTPLIDSGQYVQSIKPEVVRQ